MTAHPYIGLDESCYWKTAVAEVEPDKIRNLANPKVRLRREDRVATGGSCFAQHISRHLKIERFNFLDAEPAPETLRAEHRQKFGYELYSARYGNIYTSAQLRQLVARMVGQFEPKEPVWSTNGRFYDPFRPSIEPDGFETEVEALDSQRSHLYAVRKMFKKADVFVFTLGLTETWRSRQDGSAYPACPGTVAGSFDASRHEFVNLSMAEVVADLRVAFELVKVLNPRIRFLLTVSPVPLAATATGKHVLTATTYSKAVLRAAAGQLSDELPEVDYFPSYDIITSPVFGGSFFDDSKRTVTADGVDFVMRLFFREFCEGSSPDEMPSESTEPSDERLAKIQRKRERKRLKREMEDALCDEKALERYAR